MAKIEIGRYSNLLRRALGMKGVTDVAGELSPEVSPTWAIEDNAPEWQYLKGVRLVGAAGGQGFVAGQSPRYQLVNPAGSGVLATVTFVALETVGVQAGFIIRFANSVLPNLTTVEQNGPRDSRWGIPGTSISPLIFSGENSASLHTAGFLLYSGIHHPEGTVAEYTIPVVMAPGSSLLWGSTTQNITSLSSVAWSERGIAALELA